MPTTTWDPRFGAAIAAVLTEVDASILTPDTSLRSAGLDSLSTIDLLLRLEGTFGIQIDDALLTDSTFATAGSLWAVVEGART